jgi:hypothetical protein
MALKKSEKRLLIILGIALSVFLFDRLVLSKKGGKNTAQAQSRQQAESGVLLSSAIAEGSAVQTASMDERMQFEDWGRDPFSDSRSRTTAGSWKSKNVAGKSKETVQKPELKGLFWKGGVAFVLVNDNILKEGEEKEGLKIERVEGRTVQCRRGNRSFTLYWSESL